MSDEHETQGTSGERERPEWVREAEDALGRATEAVRVAWEETRDSRMKALESAKQAAKQLGEAIDRGVDAARSRWQAAEEEGSPLDGAAAPDRHSGADEEE